MMATFTRRLLLVMLLHGIGAKGLVEADLIMTPAGLKPGDQFRIVFVTSTVRTATSTNIADYDTFVTNVANNAGLTYNGMLVSWQAIGSTPSVNANDPTRLPISSTVPIYRLDGLIVAYDGSGLWSGHLLAPIDVNEKKAVANNNVVWTGTLSTGKKFVELELGAPGFETAVGFAPATDAEWVIGGERINQVMMPFYAVSQSLTVPSPTSVPEPRPLTTAAMAVVSMIAYGLARKRAGEPPGEPVHQTSVAGGGVTARAH
jgi:hypothetical protein